MRETTIEIKYFKLYKASMKRATSRKTTSSKKIAGRPVKRCCLRPVKAKLQV